ncbi:MAG TPA: hypothetical protein VEH07_10760 [Alphaproteobacteria bacterium]|nr:hypothetical protein [Alphaproteobacteria bacterium]
MRIEIESYAYSAVDSAVIGMEPTVEHTACQIVTKHAVAHNSDSAPDENARVLDCRDLVGFGVLQSLRPTLGPDQLVERLIGQVDTRNNVIGIAALQTAKTDKDESGKLARMVRRLVDAITDHLNRLVDQRQVGSGCRPHPGNPQRRGD